MLREIIATIAMSGLVIAAAGCVAFPTSSTSPSRSARTTERKPDTYYALSAKSDRIDDLGYQRGDHELGVMTFNMFHRDQPDEMAVLAEHLEELPEGVPDFVMLQEVVFSRNRRDGHASTAHVLADELNYFTRGTKRTSDREGVAILSRYPFDYYDANHLDARTNPLLLGFRRVSAMGEFLVPGVGRVRVVNVHFAHWPFEQHIRIQQMRQTLEWIADRERVEPADVTILGGDFNAEPGTSELSLLQDRRVNGPIKWADFNTSAPTKGGGLRGRPTRRIDHIFIAGKPCSLQSEHLVARHGIANPDGGGKVWLSDHLPVIHDYVVRNERTAAVQR